jgi:hypothetical protein
MKYQGAYVASAVATLVGLGMYKVFEGVPYRIGGLLLMFGLAGSLLTRIAHSIALLDDDSRATTEGKE